MKKVLFGIMLVSMFLVLGSRNEVSASCELSSLSHEGTSEGSSICDKPSGGGSYTEPEFDYNSWDDNGCSIWHLILGGNPVCIEIHLAGYAPAEIYALGNFGADVVAKSGSKDEIDPVTYEKWQIK